MQSVLGYLSRRLSVFRGAELRENRSLGFCLRGSGFRVTRSCSLHLNFGGESSAAELDRLHAHIRFVLGPRRSDHLVSGLAQARLRCLLWSEILLLLL